MCLCLTFTVDVSPRLLADDMLSYVTLSSLVTNTNPGVLTPGSNTNLNLVAVAHAAKYKYV